MILNEFPFVSIIIPCRNEKHFIAKCLDSILSQDYPKDNLEVLVVDGDSKDETKKIIEEYVKKYSFVKLLSNLNKYTPFGLNIGIRAARGEIIVRMDAHAGYEKDYVSKCVKQLMESGADDVGGVMKTLPAENTLSGRAIAFCLSSFFGAAGAYFRTGSDKPRWVDTVFGGCYKKEVFSPPPDGVGLYNEKLIRSQDIEFNRRLRKANGKILLVPEIVSYYYPQATLSGFIKHNFVDGFWTIYPLKFNIRIFSLRHLLPLFFAVGLLLFFFLGNFSLWFKILFVFCFDIYFLLNLLFSFKIAVRQDIKLFPFLILAFFFRHFFYGLGSIYGLIRILYEKII